MDDMYMSKSNDILTEEYNTILCVHTNIQPSTDKIVIKAFQSKLCSRKAIFFRCGDAI